MKTISKTTLPVTTDIEKLNEQIAISFPQLFSLTPQGERLALFSVSKNDDGVYVEGLPEGVDFTKLVKDSEKLKTDKQKKTDADVILANKIKTNFPQFSAGEFQIMFPTLKDAF